MKRLQGAYNELTSSIEVVNMDTNKRITIDPSVQHGKPVISGTRVPVARIIAELAGGMTKERIAIEYGITEEDVAAALSFAADLVEADEYHPLPA